MKANVISDPHEVAAYLMRQGYSEPKRLDNDPVGEEMRLEADAEALLVDPTRQHILVCHKRPTGPDGKYRIKPVAVKIESLERALKAAKEGQSTAPGSTVVWDKDANDHWGADVGEYHLSCWQRSSDGSWVWEVWAAEPTDRPLLTDGSDSLPHAKRAAELCLTEMIGAPKFATAPAQFEDVEGGHGSTVSEPSFVKPDASLTLVDLVAHAVTNTLPKGYKTDNHLRTEIIRRLSKRG